ncbi:hypothetical protein J6590_076439 [Homalodisca vitripennis]|nr:hypothetical protein J6590_076439 [Homalodisca vitripennis]
MEGDKLFGVGDGMHSQQNEEDNEHVLCLTYVRIYAAIRCTVLSTCSTTEPRVTHSSVLATRPTQSGLHKEVRCTLPSCNCMLSGDYCTLVL